jgi:UDPglucose--hexose-1-phosphate uridylyltransferase
MSEIRQDLTTEEWVIVARERAKRPSDFVPQQVKPELPVFSTSCPFCPGNESMTPSETLAYRDRETGRWRVRAVSNKFPALNPEGSTIRKSESGFFISMDGVGIHEVIVETSEHNKVLALQDESGVADVLRAYQERYNAIKQMPFVKLITIYKNFGPKAGTTLEHSHSQLIGTPIVPRHMRMQFDVTTRYFDSLGRCLYCDLAQHEIAAADRVIMETESYVVFHPFASHSPFETWITPKRNQASFGNIREEELADLAHVLRSILLKLYLRLNNPDYNYVINSAPVEDENKAYYSWHIRIIPRLTELVGFEIGSGINMNVAIPEETAKFMRDLKVE